MTTSAALSMSRPLSIPKYVAGLKSLPEMGFGEGVKISITPDTLPATAPIAYPLGPKLLAVFPRKLNIFPTNLYGSCYYSFLAYSSFLI